MDNHSTNTPSIEELEKENKALLDAIQDVKNVHIDCEHNRNKITKAIEQVIEDMKEQEDTYCPTCKMHTQYEYDLVKIKEDLNRVIYENERIIAISALNEIVHNHSNS